MNYYYRSVESNDIDSIMSLIEILKTENADVSFTELVDIKAIKDLVHNPAQLSYVAVTKEDPFRVFCIVKAKRIMTNEKSHSAFLSAATHPDARGFGLAAELTNYALKQMKAEGVNIARIYVYSNNKASLNAVKKLGFIQSGSVLRHHKDPITGEYIDDLIFHKILDE